jgi:hypothetical protein
MVGHTVCSFVSPDFCLNLYEE